MSLTNLNLFLTFTQPHCFILQPMVDCYLYQPPKSSYISQITNFIKPNLLNLCQIRM